MARALPFVSLNAGHTALVSFSLFPNLGLPTLAARRRALAMPSVRAIFGISCILLGAAMLLCQVEGSGDDRNVAPIAPRELGTQRQAFTNWVRTVDGWKRPDSWRSSAPSRPALHPLVVAAGQCLAATLGLAFFQRDER